MAIYDLDGTLIDSRADLAAAVNRMRASFGLPPLAQATIVGFVGDGQRNLVARALADAPAVAVEEGLAAMRREYAAGLLDTTTLYPGVRETLTRMRAAGWLQAVATNKPAPAAETILRGLGVRELLDAVVGGGEENLPLKPDPAPLRLAMTRAGWPGTGPAWMVGDHRTDLEAGRRAGLKRCFCRYGFGCPAQESWDLAVDDPRDFARAAGVAV